MGATWGQRAGRGSPFGDKWGAPGDNPPAEPPHSATQMGSTWGRRAGRGSPFGDKWGHTWGQPAGEASPFGDKWGHTWGQPAGRASPFGDKWGPPGDNAPAEARHSATNGEHLGKTRRPRLPIRRQMGSGREVGCEE